ncbi:MAG TPA: cytochrome c3 family protein [Noviherbaspirillum sp.]|uniref:cytochrome c3 family protein n=1 Tax=Noviherbaspirillum sp. TaxID=1926288 RepID=UPI002D69F944|nr:cytochrome c3 family protein [Noviherbaspirillum sp.]HYD94709.1 cytochrome c3 family protein [Noviherbaspirillum sp.]
MKGKESRIGRAWRMLRAAAVLLAAAAATASTPALAQSSNIAITAHNLSRSGLPNSIGNVRAPATGETEICAFCHTPHQSSTSVKGPLWNRNSSGSTYTRYTSSSLDSNTIISGFNDQPAGSSLLCLSCHDGLVALGNVNVLRGVSNVAVSLDNTNAGKMPHGMGSTTGFTRALGADLSNDHPISITYDDRLAAQDGEMTRLTTTAPAQRDTISGNIIGVRTSGYKPLLPLEPTGPGGSGQVQCATCHDPHIVAQKFLRLNRFQAAAPGAGSFNQATDQICLACHPKLGMAWAESAHANPTVADEPYKDAAAKLREFPPGTKVWQAACLNCHDTHTVQGSRRLLREGVESGTGGSGAGSFRLGSMVTPADTVSGIENTCYQCHDTATSTTRAIASLAGSTVPDIKTDFGKAVHMPISTNDQLRTKREVHDILNADFMETAENLGKNNWDNRHVECTDCHNPHRVRRNSLFTGLSAASGEGAKRTHNVGGTAANRGADGNIASGVLRGMWGVEPNYGVSTTWPSIPVTYTVKKGDPGNDMSTDKTRTYLTREYQLCLKCHSDYSNGTSPANFPALGNTLGGTTGTRATRNNMTRYTNVAAEFAANANDSLTGTDQGENNTNSPIKPGASNGAPNGAPNNHRSWHPVIFPTGRTKESRTNSTTSNFTNIRAPFNTQANIGRQTMYCSDCHGDPTSWIQGSGPDTTKTQGPHGSTEPFLLKGKWDYSYSITSATGTSPTVLCGKCHDPSGSGGFQNGEAGHTSNSNHTSSARCMNCHIAVPHGWKNKAFLANLNCIGPEAGKPAGCTNAAVGNAGQLWAPPYYNGAVLRVLTWNTSTNWSEFSCGASAGENTSGRTWMESACEGTGNASSQQPPTATY